jgi:hypothetical protein
MELSQSSLAILATIDPNEEKKMFLVDKTESATNIKLSDIRTISSSNGIQPRKVSCIR